MTTEEKNENKKHDDSFLVAMVEKLDNRDKNNSAGYVTYSPELQGILSQMSPLVPVAILEAQNSPYGADSDVISVEVKLSFCLERSLLGNAAVAESEDTEA